MVSFSSRRSHSSASESIDRPSPKGSPGPMNFVCSKIIVHCHSVEGTQITHRVPFYSGCSGGDIPSSASAGADAVQLSWSERRPCLS